MAVTTVLFDLDGTLLPMDQDVFTTTYFKGLAARLINHGYEPKELVEAIWSGTMAMINNTGEKNNENVFWDDFSNRYGEKARQDEPHFEEFYKTDFASVKDVCGFDSKAAQVVRKLKDSGIRVALATNPIFPAIATESRIRWAGLEPEDFELYTTYENSCHCKPNLDYYRDIVAQLGVEPCECLMVGNDVGDDMVARELGMQVFLLTDCLINRNDADISIYPSGDFQALSEYIDELIVR